MTLTTSEIDELIDRHHAPRRTIGLIALAGIGLIEAVAITTLLATEPEPLPLETIIALAMVAIGGVVWASYAGWRLVRREAVFLHERVVGTGLATAFSSIATIGGLAIASDRGALAAALTIFTVGGALIGSAVIQFRRAILVERGARARLDQLRA